MVALHVEPAGLDGLERYKCRGTGCGDGGGILDLLQAYGIFPHDDRLDRAALLLGEYRATYPQIRLGRRFTERGRAGGGRAGLRRGGRTRRPGGGDGAGVPRLTGDVTNLDDTQLQQEMNDESALFGSRLGGIARRR